MNCWDPILKDFPLIFIGYLSTVHFGFHAVILIHTFVKTSGIHMNTEKQSFWERNTTLKPHVEFPWMDLPTKLLWFPLQLSSHPVHTNGNYFITLLLTRGGGGLKGNLIGRIGEASSAIIPTLHAALFPCIQHIVAYRKGEQTAVSNLDIYHIKSWVLIYIKTNKKHSRTYCMHTINCYLSNIISIWCGRSVMAIY